MPRGEGKWEAGWNARHRSAESQLREPTTSLGPITSLRGALSVPDPSPALAEGPRSDARRFLPSGKRSLGPRLLAQQKLRLPAGAPGLRRGPARPAPLGRKLEAGRARLPPQEKSGKVPPPPCAAPQSGHQGQVLTAPGFVSAQRTGQKCGARRPGALPAGLPCPYSLHTPRAAGRPAERQQRSRTPPVISSPLPDGWQQLCVTRRGKGRRGCG